MVLMEVGPLPNLTLPLSTLPLSASCSSALPSGRGAPPPPRALSLLPLNLLRCCVVCWHVAGLLRVLEPQPGSACLLGACG